MSQQRKLNCPICNYPKLTNLSRHLTTVHSISGKERKCLMSMSCKNGEPSICSTTTHFGNSLPKKSSLPEQRQLPNPASKENKDELIPCLYDSLISYERVWGTNVHVMDYDIFKLHHPFSMLVAGP